MVHIVESRTAISKHLPIIAKLTSTTNFKRRCL